MMSSFQRRPEILVVDDNPENLDVLSFMLADCDYCVRPAWSGRLAIEAAECSPPDIILLDVRMPGMDGFEVCREMKKNGELSDVPVIFVSGLNETIDKVRAFESGAVDYVTKPVRIEEVEARIESHLQIRRLQLQLEKQNRELGESHRRLQSLESLRDDLTRMIVHDLRNLAAAMMSCIKLVQVKSSGDLSPASREYLERSRARGDDLLEMINNLLDVSRLEESKLPLVLSDVDLVTLVETTVTDLNPDGRQVGLDLPGREEPTHCDESLIRRVIMNLLGNALKFTPPEGEIAIRMRRDETGVRLEIRDTGPGIPPGFHHRIFDKFSQVDPKQRKRHASSGLGLAFCKLAVEAHGGRIGVQSMPGAGSTFWFTLPPHPLPAPGFSGNQEIPD